MKRRSVARAKWSWSALALVCALAACTQAVERKWSDGTRRGEGRQSTFTRAEEGLWTYWFPNGELREQGRYLHGRRVGSWRQWYPNGSPRSAGQREWNPTAGGSLREGVWTFWHENGVLAAHGAFEQGLREGQWDYNLDSGALDGNQSGEYHRDQRIDWAASRERR